MKSILPPLEYPESYDYILKLPEKKYKWYLKLQFFKHMRYIPNIDNPKTFNEKIQWLKINSVTERKRDLTDKVLVRKFIEEKIGSKYLKKVFQTATHFNEIDFSPLPDKFLIKCNHGCKWHYFIKDKKAFIENKSLMKSIEIKMEKLLSTEFTGIGILELQYRGIKPLIFVEEFIDNQPLEEFQIYCFNGKPKFYEKVIFGIPTSKRCVWDENYNLTDVCFDTVISTKEEVPPALREAVELSKILASDFKFVRVDWMNTKEKLYFNEMTFTPYSGYLPLKREIDIRLGNYLDLTKGE